MEYHYEDCHPTHGHLASCYTDADADTGHVIDTEDQRTLIRFLRLLEVSKRDVARFTRRSKDVALKYGSLSEEYFLTAQQLRVAQANHERILAQFKAATGAF